MRLPASRRLVLISLSKKSKLHTTKSLALYSASAGEVCAYAKIIGTASHFCEV
jgi:hypothetical protein